MGKKILIVGHAYIVDANRDVWSEMGARDGVEVDLIIPKTWSSNLLGEVVFQENEQDRAGLKNIMPIDVYKKGNGSFYFYHFCKLYKALNQKKYDLIVVNQEGWSLSLLFINLIRLFTINKKSKLFLMVAQNIKKNNLRWAIPLEKFNLTFVQLVLGCCSETEDVIRWKGLSTAWKYFPLFFNSKIETKAIAGANKKKTIGYIGRLSDEKGLDTLLDAYNELKKEGEYSLVIAGDGPLKNEVIKEDIDYMGLIPHGEVKNFYKKIDILVVPSKTKSFWKEQFGRVIVEAIASGVMVVGSDSGAIPEVMTHLDLPYIFKEGDSRELVTKLKQCFNDLEYKRDGLDNSMRLCTEKFSQKAFIDRLIEYERSV